MKILLTLSFLLIFHYITTAQTISRIEPANWWIGMKWNVVNLIIYGDKINDLSPTVNFTGVEISKVEKVENPNYLFITLNIKPEAKPGIVKITFKKSNKIFIIKDFPLLEREQNSSNRESFSQKDNILLIVPDRFSNGNIENDSTKNTIEKVNRKFGSGRHGGDIQGIINNLDYIQSLGYTQIWNTPLIENDMTNYSYHGYAATDFYKIDPRFGTNEDFKNLVIESKKRGIGLIWDVVLNHCGSNYYFVKDAPSTTWLNPKLALTTNHLKSTLVDPYVTKIDRIEYNDAWFDGKMADMNQRDPLMANFLTQNCIWWIEYANLSGFRVDTYSYSDKTFLAQWTKSITDEYPNFNIVAEEWSSDPGLISYWQNGKINNDGYKSFLPSLMDFALTENLVKSFNTESTWASSWKQTYESLARDYYFPNPYNQLIFPDNHDMDRIFTQLKSNFEHWKLAMVMYATTRGIPQFQYGTEYLATNEQQGNHGEIRSDFYGGFKDDEKDAKTGVGLTAQEKEAKAYFSKLLNWRKNKTIIHTGKLKHYGPQLNDVYVYFRYNDTEKVMVLLNKNKEKVSLDLSRFEEMIPNKFKAFDVISNQEIIADKTLEIPAKTAMILELLN